MVCHVLASENGIPDLDKQVVPQGSVGEEDTIASSSEAQGFVGAVQRGDVETALNVLSSGSDQLREHCGNHLVSLGSHRLVELINSASNYTVRMLQAIFTHADQPLIGEVFDEIGLMGDNSLSDMAVDEDVVCRTGNFIYLLSKIFSMDIRKSTVRYGVGALIDANKPEYLDPLLFALQIETPQGSGLTSVAICAASQNTTSHTNGGMLYARHFFDHPAVSAKDYSDALDLSYKFEDPKKKLFYWLLARADGQDLGKVRGLYLFSSKPSEFQDAVNQILRMVGPEGRHELGYRRRVAILADAIDRFVTRDLFGLISEYAGWTLYLA